jgi:hypothetical protein
MKFALPLLLLLPAQAQAKWPEDISLSGMSEHGEIVVVDTVLLGDAYDTVVRELGTAIANQPFAPARTLGMKGFAFDFNNGFAFNSTRQKIEGEPSPWERVHPEEEPSPYILTPGVSFRKGLPLSLEAGANLNWIGLSRTAIFGGYGRLAIIEGYRPAPDLTLQWGYSGYVGNQELDVGVIDVSITLGTTLPFGALPNFNQSWFSPFLSYTTLRVKAQPNLTEEQALEVGAVAYTKKQAIVLPQVSGGFEMTTGTFTLGAFGSWAPGSIATARAKLGWTY